MMHVRLAVIKVAARVILQRQKISVGFFSHLGCLILMIQVWGRLTWFPMHKSTSSFFKNVSECYNGRIQRITVPTTTSTSQKVNPNRQVPLVFSIRYQEAKNYCIGRKASQWKKFKNSTLKLSYPTFVVRLVQFLPVQGL